MRCPFCSADKESLQVIDSRTCDNGRSIRRRRKCVNCGKRFTTYERVEQTSRLMVIKKDGRRVPWDKDKVRTGIERACFKRPVAEEDVQRAADEVEEEVRAAYDREVPSTAVGQIVVDRLRRLDHVAYVRFASVYREFKTVDDLVAEARAVIEARHYDDVPGQGKLFVEPTDARPAASAVAAANGSARPGVNPEGGGGAAGTNGSAGGHGDAAAAAKRPRRGRRPAATKVAEEPLSAVAGAAED